MTKEKFRSYFVHPFPDAGLGVPFGVDATTFAATTGARFHGAADYRLEWPKNQSPGKYYVRAPMNSVRTEWWPAATSGANKDVTIFDLVNSDGSVRFRMMHLHPEEFTGHAARLAFPREPGNVPTPGKRIIGGGFERGQDIAPAGQAGLSLAAPAGQKPGPGANARHLHLAVLLAQGAYDDVLKEAFGERWDEDLMAIWGQAHPGLADKMRAQGYSWANHHAALRLDPYTRKEALVVDPAWLFGWQ